MPEFEKASRKLHKEGLTAARLAILDASTKENRLLSHKYNFKTVPAFYYINGDLVQPYYGGRKAIDFISYVRKRNGPAWLSVENMEKLEKYKTDEDVFILGMFKDEESQEAQAFKEASRDIDTVLFGLTSSEDILKKFNIQSHGIVALKKFDEGETYFDEEYDIDDISDWSKKQRLPIVIEFSLKNANEVFGGETKRHILLIMKKSSPTFLETFRIFRKIAIEFRFTSLFIFMDADVKEHSRMMSNYFKVTPDEYPAIRGVGLEEDTSKALKPFEKGFSEEILRNFVKKYTSGKLDKWQGRKSADEPKDWNARTLKVLTARTFWERIKGKDALVLFYRPNSAASNEVLSVFGDFADEYNWKSDRLIIAKVDASENDVDRISYDTLPAIKFISHDSNIAIDFKGSRTIEAMMSFIDSNSLPLGREQTVEHAADSSEPNIPEKEL